MAKKAESLANSGPGCPAPVRHDKIQFLLVGVVTAQQRRSVARLAAVALLPFAAGYFLSYLYRTVNAVLGPRLSVELGLDAGELGLLTSAYFASFALFQLPLGTLLDRFGPRRVEASLLVLAAAGGALFAVADGAVGLAAGRALIGLGVSACLMGAFKANVLFWPPARLPLVNACVLACGGLGATVATAPVEWLLGFTDWRTIFALLAVLTLGVALLIYLVVPEQSGGGGGESLRRQLAAVVEIYRSALFWRVAPVTIATQAVHLSYVTLWAGPWLSGVAGYDRPATAGALLLMTAAMIPGYLTSGIISDRLTRVGIGLPRIIAVYTGVFVLIQIPLMLGVTTAAPALWVGFGLIGTSAILPYALLTQSFAPSLAGRVNTAINVLVFAGTFLVQSGVGFAIDFFADRGPAAPLAGHRTALAILLVLEIAGYAWFLGKRWPARSMADSAA